MLEQLRSVGAELRTAPDDIWAKVLHAGTYALRADDAWVVLIVRQGLPPGPAASVRERHADPPLGTALPAFRSLWPGATRHSGTCSLEINDVVRALGDRRLGRVERVVLRTSGYEVHVLMEGVIRQFGESALEKVEGNPLDPSFWVRSQPATSEEIAFTLTWTKLRHPLTDTLYSFASSKTVFRPYQFVPVLKLLSSSTGRLLIADEVGLGKTIEAGLIWSELEQRMHLDRILVVAPAALTLKWKAEMQRRFDRNLDVLTPADLLDFARGLRDGQNPRLQAVISMQVLRGAKEALEILNEVNPQFDLVIVDEAHAMRNRGTSTHLLGQMLSDWSDYLIFLSATPLNLGRDDLFNLVNLLSEEEFGDRNVFGSQLEPNQVLNEMARNLAADGGKSPSELLACLDSIRAMELGRSVMQRPDFAALRELLNTNVALTFAETAQAKRLIAELNSLSSVFTRTRKVDVPDAKALRRAIQIDVRWSDEEYAFYRQVQRAYKERALATGIPPGFAMQMPLRQTASCIPAMQALLRENHPELLTSEVDDLDEQDVDEAPAVFDGLMDSIDLGQPLGRDSKFEALKDRMILARTRGMRQVMIFSFFRRTLTYLGERLSADFSVRVMTGQTKMSERQRIMEEFRDGKFEVLLLSQVGSEGLDFEFCNVLVNYDLPWNPMQVEQRIGRLDRFGQEHEKIFIFNMHVPGTIESDIFERLYARIGVFEQSIGELEPILRDDFASITRDLLDPRLTPEERQQMAERVAVALEARKQEIQRLGESHGLLSSIDQLKIDGMTEAGPSDGRFVGQSEIRRLIERVLGRLGGRLSQPDSEGICSLVGSVTLAQRLRAGGIPGRGSMYPVSKFAALMRDEEVVRVTFVTDVASKHNVELLSTRHPLVILALDEFGGESLSLKRYGAVAVPGVAHGKRLIARVDLAESTGLRPRVELWVTAVDAVTGRPDDEAGVKLLTALAEGTLRDVQGSTTRPSLIRLAEVDALSFERKAVVEAGRLAENVALVDARIASRMRSFELKIMRVDRTLEEVRRERREPSIVRLHEGRRRNLANDARSVADELAPKKNLSLSLTQVAVLVLEGT
ncbi:DEAD/DEAH box helicase family protein [Nocardioides panacis]|uniref:DEAD/DEAH box helicase family protein n=1 Tax=Nocardioides panacis TaxID=2849501 RepID=A0A975T092_9ACTN|nr:helicase-related protein [Nocardioides panacis]QWZ09235.1 DEAD/DEAH box helicase family protein [Nocardioides panacis]